MSCGPPPGSACKWAVLSPLRVRQSVLVWCCPTRHLLHSWFISLIQLVEEFQSRRSHPLYCIDGSGQNLIRNNFLRLPREAFLQTAPPCDPYFSVDMDDVDSRGDCLSQVLVVGARSAMQRKQGFRSSFDLRDTVKSRRFLVFPCTMLCSI